MTPPPRQAGGGKARRLAKLGVVMDKPKKKETTNSWIPIILILPAIVLTVVLKKSGIDNDLSYFIGLTTAGVTVGLYGIVRYYGPSKQDRLNNAHCTIAGFFTVILSFAMFLMVPLDRWSDWVIIVVVFVTWLVLQKHVACRIENTGREKTARNQG